MFMLWLGSLKDFEKERDIPALMMSSKETVGSWDDDIV